MHVTVDDAARRLLRNADGRKCWVASLTSPLRASGTACVGRGGCASSRRGAPGAQTDADADDEAEPVDPMMWMHHVGQIERECRVPIVQVAHWDQERVIDGSRIDIDCTRGALTLLDDA